MGVVFEYQLDLFETPFCTKTEGCQLNSTSIKPSSIIPCQYETSQGFYQSLTRWLV